MLLLVAICGVATVLAGLLAGAEAYYERDVPWHHGKYFLFFLLLTLIGLYRFS